MTTKGGKILEEVKLLCPLNHRLRLQLHAELSIQFHVTLKTGESPLASSNKFIVSRYVTFLAGEQYFYLRSCMCIYFIFDDVKKCITNLPSCFQDIHVKTLFFPKHSLVTINHLNNALRLILIPSFQIQ